MKNENSPSLGTKDKKSDPKPVFVWEEKEFVPGYKDETANFKVIIDNEECEVAINGVRTEKYLSDSNNRIPRDEEYWEVSVWGDLKEIAENFEGIYQFNNKEEAVKKAEELASELIALKVDIENQKKMDDKMSDADNIILNKIGRDENITIDKEAETHKKIEELKILLDIYKSKSDKTNDNVELIEKENPNMEEIVYLFKNYKIDQIVLAGKNTKEGIALTPDFDTQAALYLLHNLNKNELNQTYSEGAVSTLVNNREDLEPQLEREGNQWTTGGLKIILDTGGEWLKIIYKDGEKIIYLDHHGEGKRGATSGAKMVYEMMESAGILIEEPWVKDFVEMVNTLDNLSYVDRKKGKEGEIFNENYFVNYWPETIFALAEDYLPLEKVIEFFKKGIIKDPFSPITEADLNGETGQTKINFNGENKTLKETTVTLRVKAKETITSVKKGEEIQVEKGYNFEKTKLGKVLFHDFSKKNGKINTIDNKLAFKAIKALGYDTYIVWNEKSGTFFINSNIGDLTTLAEELNKKNPNCAKDIRGAFVFGKTGNMKKEDFLNLIDPNIINNSK